MLVYGILLQLSSTYGSSGCIPFVKGRKIWLRAVEATLIMDKFKNATIAESLHCKVAQQVIEGYCPEKNIKLKVQVTKIGIAQN